jgi:hypothetical protein
MRLVAQVKSTMLERLVMLIKNVSSLAMEPLLTATVTLPTDVKRLLRHVLLSPMILTSTAVSALAVTTRLHVDVAPLLTARHYPAQVVNRCAITAVLQVRINVRPWDAKEHCVRI